MLLLAKTIVPVALTVICELLVYCKRLRNNCWLDVVIDDAELVETIEKV
jgi:hypothetical protein